MCTAVVKNEKNPQVSGDLLHLIINNSDDIFYCFNLQTSRFEYICPSIEEMTGISAGEFLTMDVEKMVSRIHPDYLPVLKDAQKFAEKEGRAKAEYPYMVKNGEYRWISDHMNVVRDNNGKLLFRLGNCRDITELKNAEKALKESESKFRAIVETTNEGIWQVDERLITKYVNRKMAGLLGYTIQEMIGKSIFDFMEEKLISVTKKVHNSREFGIEGTFEHKFIRKDRSCITTLSNVTSMWDITGNYIGYIGMVTDITERIKTEETLRKTQKKLDMALENGNIGIWEWDLKTGTVVWDERTEKMFGLEPGTFGRTKEAFEELVHEDDVPYIRQAFLDTLEKDKPFEVVFRNKADSTYITAKGLLTRGRKGKPLNVTGVFFDVTGMKKGAEQALFKLNEELRRSNLELQQFAYVASHDLQEPLRMVSSFTQLLQKRYQGRLDEDANEYIKYAVEGSKRMYDLINSLLLYSRIQTKGRIFDKVDMNTVLQKVMDNLSLIIKETNAEINHNDLPVIFADENQMIELLQNLVGNSIKFSIDTPYVTVSASLEDDNYVFLVKDSGIGIDPIYSEKIFRIFQRLHGRNEYEGTGIGLAICKRIVERHGGKIWLQSEPSKGSTFCFSIPRSIYK